ncbi:sucrose-6-phosphate hydrolase [Xylocopilactobacillus apicola]|uniref:Sucrose-6-phosphate hydrolase n=1 Tax=Xylocopilactobacillus apicola TaxID=2932184 RepID=A0AAU9D948_9LACO|nr:sucrose-6-phosphate hydrolase [Xylocopilactobacillus apicola]BDR58880.1 invertase [Xylocopilactobacillus apicola]
MITNWTRKLRYKKYDQWSDEYLRELKEMGQNSIWHSKYHVEPEFGLLNDPNGFSFFNGQYHLFYQYYPFGAVHGLKSWYHVTSTDLIHWHNEGIALKPDSKFDEQGVYSGSALSIDQQLLLLYTGNIRTTDNKRFSYQNAAWLKKDGSIQKEPSPLIEKLPAGFSSEFRDPQIIKCNDQYRVLIGAQTLQNEGKIAVYEGHHLHHLKYKGCLHFSDQPMGYMAECPNLIMIDQQPLLIFCPQGLDHQILNYQNIYPNCYIIGKNMDWENLQINEAGTINNLDDGFDFYATQVFAAPDGRQLAVSWINLPDLIYPNDADGWTGSLSLIKELSIKNGYLYQYPVKETKKLRHQQIRLDQIQTKSFELEAHISANQCGEIQLFKTKTTFLGVEIDARNGIVTVDRSQSSYPLAQQFGQTRQSFVPAHQDIQINIFADQTICEIFINDGYKVQTLRYFSAPEATKIITTEAINRCRVWELKK